MIAPEAFRITIVEFASPEPVTAGVDPVDEYGELVSVPTITIVGVLGGRESTTNVVVPPRLVFPAASVRVILYVFDHSGSIEDGMNE
jgi:hypothetical protein